MHDDFMRIDREIIDALACHPSLAGELVKIPYPMDDYATFSQAWPLPAATIKDFHRYLSKVFAEKGVSVVHKMVGEKLEPGDPVVFNQATGRFERARG